MLFLHQTSLYTNFRLTFVKLHLILYHNYNEKTKVSGRALPDTINYLPKAAHHFCVKNKRIFYKKRKAQKQRKSSVSELFDLVTRTGIEPMIPP